MIAVRDVLLRIVAVIRHLVVSGWRLVVGGVIRILSFCEQWLIGQRHARYGVAVTRILLGFVGFGLLWTNYTARSYLYGPASFWNGEEVDRISQLPEVWVFGLGDLLSGDLVAFTILYLVAAALALAVMLGWRTRLTLPLFFALYVGIIELNSASGDQGDNAYRICLFWLMFADPAGVLSMDARRRAAGITGPNRTIWDRIRRIWRGERLLPEWLQNAMHNLVLVLLTAQVTFIYVAGGLYKAGGDPWAGGTAVYAPLQVEKFSTWPELADLITAWGPMVALASWGSILLQISFPFMLLNRFTRILALVGILGFHAAIGLLMGLPWFSLSMVAIDAIFVRDRSWIALGSAARGAWRRARAGSDDRAADDRVPRRPVVVRKAPIGAPAEPREVAEPVREPVLVLAGAGAGAGAGDDAPPLFKSAPAAQPIPIPKAAPAPGPAPKRAPAPRPAPMPKPQPAPIPKPRSSPAPDPVAAPEPEPIPAPTPTPEPAAKSVTAKVRTVAELPAWARNARQAPRPDAAPTPAAEPAPDAPKRPAWLDEAAARAKAERER
ncbi:HTTM domain-containing protein [Microbacterium paludicola]|uniref:HTTM domain-containing protein n=1 Tax=Microbacterium paludicola TaxID=300019 RepID=UPI0031E0FA5C